MSEAICRTCGQKKLKMYSHMRRNAKVYVDEQSHEWHGKQCYECKTAEQWKWRKTKRGRYALEQKTG